MTLTERIDDGLERHARELSRGHTRRSWLGRGGKLALALAGASTAEGVLAGRAEAHHFCGHTGTSPTCSNESNCVPYAAAGGCWSACCSGKRRSICDCCGRGTTSGYCPSGYKVICVRRVFHSTTC